MVRYARCVTFGIGPILLIEPKINDKSIILCNEERSNLVCNLNLGPQKIIDYGSWYENM